MENHLSLSPWIGGPRGLKYSSVEPPFPARWICPIVFTIPPKFDKFVKKSYKTAMRTIKWLVYAALALLLTASIMPTSVMAGG
jgi:hypothetical protein